MLADKSESRSVPRKLSLVPFLLEAEVLINKILKFLVGDTNFREQFITIFFCKCKLKSFDLSLERSEIVPRNLRSQSSISKRFMPSGS